jgi:nicotinamide riboside kinase
VPEYAREYIDQLERPYDEEDIFRIAKGQLLLEKEAEHKIVKGNESAKYLFCDTDALVTKIWSDVKYGRCNPWILEQVEEHIYDLYLLCNIDLPWEYDPQREHPTMREKLFNIYLNEMKEREWNFRIVAGLGEERLQNAIKFIDESF